MTPKLLTLPVLAAAVLPSGLSAAANEPGRVNIVHIMSDDHSYQTISAYGGPVSALAPTPNIDRLAARGMLFRRAYVENSISTPSRATLLTGKYSHMHGQIKLGARTFFPGQTTFPMLMQDAGYQTAVVGKWHLVGVGPDGFDHYKILEGQGNYYAPEFRTEDTDGKFVREDGYVAGVITDGAIEWLEGRDKEKPFCLLVHHKSVHRNWFPEIKYTDLYDDVEFPEPPTLFDNYDTRSDAARTQQMSVARDMEMSGDLKVWQMNERVNNPAAFEKEFSRMTSEEKKAFTDAYEAENEAFLAADLTGKDLARWKYQRYLREYTRCVRSLDDQIGRLLDYLDASGLSENTIIVYTSDQGFYMGEHDWFDKRFMYEESFRTPLVISYPAQIAPGSVSDALVQNIDFAPTYLSLAGVEVPEEMCGVPLSPLFKNGKAPKTWRDELYYHYYEYPSMHNVRRHDGIMTKDYKLIHFKDGGGGNGRKDTPIDTWELYDLRKDPTEVNNVYDNPRYAEVVADMKKRLADKRVELDVDESKFNLEAWKNRPVRTIQEIAPDNAGVLIEGAMFVKYEDGKAILNRHSDSLWGKENVLIARVKADTQSGVRIVFKTDSKTVKPLFDDRADAERRAATNFYGIFENGRFVRNAPGAELTLTASTDGPTEWEIALPIMYGVDFRGLVIDEGAKLFPVERAARPVYVAIGDSITHGAGQMQAGSQISYPYVVALANGYNLYNLAVGGSQISPAVAGDLTGIEADIITVMWGFNDWNATGGDIPEIAKRYTELLSALRRTQPGAKIYCITPSTARDESGAAGRRAGANKPPLGAVRDAERGVAEAMQKAGDKNLFIVEGNSISAVEDLQGAVHFTNEGSQRFGAALARLLE